VILGVNLAAYVFLALQHLARVNKLWMYYGDQICCEKWIISSVKSRLDYAEIPYDSSIFRVCRLRGLDGAILSKIGEMRFKILILRVSPTSELAL
jgi:hypothetical protein